MRTRQPNPEEQHDERRAARRVADDGRRRPAGGVGERPCRPLDLPGSAARPGQAPRRGRTGADGHLRAAARLGPGRRGVRHGRDGRRRVAARPAGALRRRPGRHGTPAVVPGHRGHAGGRDPRRGRGARRRPARPGSAAASTCPPCPGRSTRPARSSATPATAGIFRSATTRRRSSPSWWATPSCTRAPRPGSASCSTTPGSGCRCATACARNLLRRPRPARGGPQEPIVGSAALRRRQGGLGAPALRPRPPPGAHRRRRAAHRTSRPPARRPSPLPGAGASPPRTRSRPTRSCARVYGSHTTRFADTDLSGYHLEYDGVATRRFGVEHIRQSADVESLFAPADALVVLHPLAGEPAGLQPSRRAERRAGRRPALRRGHRRAARLGAPGRRGGPARLRGRGPGRRRAHRVRRPDAADRPLPGDVTGTGCVLAGHGRASAPRRADQRRGPRRAADAHGAVPRTGGDAPRDVPEPGGRRPDRRRPRPGHPGHPAPRRPLHRGARGRRHRAHGHRRRGGPGRARPAARLPPPPRRHPAGVPAPGQAGPRPPRPAGGHARPTRPSAGSPTAGGSRTTATSRRSTCAPTAARPASPSGRDRSRASQTSAAVFGSVSSAMAGGVPSRFCSRDSSEFAVLLDSSARRR